MALCVMVLATSLAGCGRYARRSSAPATTEPANVSVGADLDLSNITTTTTSTPTEPGQTTPSTQAVVPNPNPVTTENDGFELTLQVDGGTTHKADQPFTMRFMVKNISGKDRRWDPNQKTYFIMQTGEEGGGSWRDSDCAPGKPSGQPAKVIKNGETLTFTARYPGPADRLDNSDACRRAPRGYGLIAGFVWCPDDALVNGVCDSAASRTVPSGTIGVWLT